MNNINNITYDDDVFYAEQCYMLEEHIEIECEKDRDISERTNTKNGINCDTVHYFTVKVYTKIKPVCRD